MLFLQLILLCFSCLGGYVHNDNYIDDHISPKPKEAAYLNEYGIQLALSLSDLASYEFIWYFINGVSGEPGSQYYNFSTKKNEAFQLTLTNTTTNIYSCADGIINLSGNYFGIRKMFLNKFAVETNQYDYPLYRYIFSFYDNNDNVVLAIQYRFSQLINSNEAEYNGDFVYYVDYYLDQNVSNTFGAQWCIYENSNDGYCPLIAYWFDYYQNNKYSNLNSDYNVGYNNGLRAGRSSGWQEGYQTGLAENETDTTAQTIFNGIFTVAMLPTNVFLSILNFEVFGINIGGLASGLLTIAIIVIILKFIMGRSKDD